MPLNAGAPAAIRTNLEGIQNRQRVYAVSIGTLTPVQLDNINIARLGNGLNPIVEDVVFVGGHIYKSRVLRDGYTIDDVIDQIASAMDQAAKVLNAVYMTAMENPSRRADRYGNLVLDRAVFECSTRHPRAELFSVIPRGDLIKPIK